MSLGLFGLVLSFLYLADIAKADYLDNRFKTEHNGTLCARTCGKGDLRICYFEFVIEFYQAMGVACKNCTNGIAEDCAHPQCVIGDGIQKGFMSINRQLPGPPIHVCLGDYIIVDVKNKAPGTATSIHWHGLSMRDSKFMDGVPYVTQCPIAFGTSFRYQFETKQVGTYFYHAHAGFQRVNGVYGALIIRQAKAENPLATFYDYDLCQHNLVISDWLHHYAEFLYPGVQRHLNKPDAVLLNGRGTFINKTTRIRETAPPPHVFYVISGRKYRLRVIAAHSFNCPMQLQVQSHTLTIIATDGYELEPMEFDTLVLNAGERYDFVLHTNQAPADYWIRLRGLAVCELMSLTEAFVLLRYKVSSNEEPIPKFPGYDETYAPGALLNYPNQTGENCYVTQLKAFKEDLELLEAKPDVKLFIGFHNYPLQPAQVFDTGRYEHFRNLLNDVLEVAAINNITFMNPSSPLLSQPHDVDESLLCDQYHLPKSCDNLEICPCVHRIKVAKGDIVEMLLVDETKEPQLIHHPIHLHGHHFMVTHLGQRPCKVQKLKADSENIPKYPVNNKPPMKDTVSIPTYGYAVVRFRADNVGFWFLHCHYSYHVELGMALVLQVGEKSEMPEPPDGFPKCGNYLPNVF